MSDERGEMVAWLEDEKKLSANGRRTAMLDRILAALPVAGEPVAWCPRDKNGHLYVEHSNSPRDLVEEEVRELNAMPTSTDMPTFQPFDVWPLYASPPSAPEEREDAERLRELERGLEALVSPHRVHGYAIIEDAAVPVDELWWIDKDGKLQGKIKGFDPPTSDAARHGTEEGA